MIWLDGNLAANDLAELTEVGVKIIVVPFSGLKSFDEDGSALNVTTTWISSDGMKVVRQSSALHVTFNLREPEVSDCLLGILDAVEHYKCVVEVFEERPRKTKIKNIYYNSLTS